MQMMSPNMPVPLHDWHTPSPMILEGLRATGAEGTEDIEGHELLLQNVSIQGL